MSLATSLPFFQSSAGVITLLLLGALTTFVVTVLPNLIINARRETRTAALQQQQRADVQTQKLDRIVDAIMPDGRPGLVARVEQLERNMSVITLELENHVEVSKAQLATVNREITEIKEYLKRKYENNNSHH